MAWWASGGLLDGMNDLWGTIFGSRKRRDAQAHAQIVKGLDLDQATLMQFAAEFAGRQNRTWVEALVDALNRLPRPVLTFSVIGLFILAPLDPERFLKIATAFEVIPPGFWALLSIIVGFYFGGRMQLKAQDFRLKGEAVATAQKLMDVQAKLTEQFDTPLTEHAYRAALADRTKPLPNQVILEWNRRRQSS